MVVSASVFRVGSQIVEFPAATAEVLAELAKIFPRVNASNSPIKTVAGQHEDVESALLALSECLLADYQGHLWVEAAVLTAPHGGKVMICGGSESGKSTLTAALCQLDWKMISEDVAFILPDRTIPKIIRPVSLREGSAERIAAATGVPVTILDDRWYFNPQSIPDSDSRLPLPLSAVTMIYGVNPDDPGEISLEDCSPERLVRELLPYSNVLRMDGGIEFLMQCLSASPCRLMHGGSIAQRISAVDKLARG